MISEVFYLIFKVILALVVCIDWMEVKTGEKREMVAQKIKDVDFNLIYIHKSALFSY